MKSPLTRAQAVAAAAKSLQTGNDALGNRGPAPPPGEAFVIQCEAIGIKFSTPAEIENAAFEFILEMSTMWKSGSAADIAHDMKAAGYTITRSKPEET